MEKARKMEHIRILFCVLMSVGMVLLAEGSGEKEILFPEIAALVTGAWAAGKQPWKTNRFQIVVLMTISAVAGVVLVRFVPVGRYGKVLLGYLFVGFCLSVAKSGLAPMISACILPVLMGTESWVYPISVGVMAAIIAVGQSLMEGAGLRDAAVYLPVERAARDAALYWGKRAVVLAVLVALPIFTGQIFFIAPPLIVLFTEFSEPVSPLRQVPVRIWLVTAGAAFAGSIARMILCTGFGLPLTVAAIVGILAVFAIFRVAGRMFPPAGALALLPLIIPESSLIFFGAEVAVGAGVLIVAAMGLFRKP